MIKDFCSIGSTWNQNDWLRWAIPSLIGLLLLTLLTRCNPIENDLGGKTQSLLNEKGMAWAATSLDGRDVTLTGEAPDKASRESAIELTQGVYGVRTVDHDISLKQWSSSTFNLKQDGEQIVLSGNMPDQDSIDVAVSKAHTLYGDTNVTNKLSISDSASVPAWLTGTTAVMATLYNARNIAIDVSDDKVNITAEVETEADKAQLIAEATASYGDNFSESISVVKTRPSVEDIAAIKLVEEARIAEESRLIAEADAARIAEEFRLAEETESARLAEEARFAAEAEAVRLAAQEAQLVEDARLAALEEKLIAHEAELAKIAAEKQRLADIEAATLKLAQAETAFLASCQNDFEQTLDDNPSIFNQDTSMVSGASYGVMSMLAQKVNYCSDLLHSKNQYIDVSAHTGENDTFPIDASTGQQRIYSAISYLEMISGAHPGLLRPNSNKTAATTPSNTASTAQLHFNISE